MHKADVRIKGSNEILRAHDCIGYRQESRFLVEPLLVAVTQKPFLTLIACAQPNQDQDFLVSVLDFL